jgi:hypothetical protein
VDGGAFDRLERQWRWWVLLFWIATALILLWMRKDAIHWFALSDTDDNMRMMQVRGLLGGQDWYDLRQHRLDPTGGGADIHWSRLVDLPIAGFKLLLAPFIGGLLAEKWAAALAPFLPMAATMAAVAVTVRRVVSPRAFALGIAVLLCAHSTRGMWAPLRIDHHGWQLAFLALAVVGLTDKKRARGGAILGIATALSLTVGLEMLLYFALLGGILVLLWVRDGAEGRRLLAYGASLAGGTSLGFLLFASYANRAPVCDALSPVWLSVALAGGAVVAALSLLPLRSPLLRLGAAVGAAILLAAAFALAWPGCLGRLEGVSPEAQAMWLDNVREARPIYAHGFQTAVAIAALPVIGLIGYALALWRDRADPERRALWLAFAAPAALGAGLLLWQSRAGPAAQLLAVPGATMLGWMAIGWARGSGRLVIRVVGTVFAFLLVSGLLAQQAARLIPQAKKPANQAVNNANARCPTIPALRPIAKLPKGHVLTFVDLGPRLIVLTHHDAVAGPYHRNDEDIVDVMTAFRGSPETARGIVDKRRIDYVLICPNLSESTVYSSRAKNGFYVQLAAGKVPAWLQPIPLPADSPYKMWQVVRPRS